MASKMAMLTLAMAAPAVQANEADPIGKVIQMLSDLQAKIVAEGKAAQKVYDEFSEFCEDRSRNLGFEIKTGKQSVSEATASIEKETATAASLTAKIEEISASISVNEADLKAATEIRNKENAAFVAEEKELIDVIDTIERAIGILEKEMSKHGASMMQLQSANSVAQALSIMVEASSLNSADASQLSAFLQNSQESDEESLGAPAAAVYKGSSGGIIQTMQDLLEKAQAQLDEARKTESKALQAYQMLASSLKDEIKYSTKDLSASKHALSSSNEHKATSQGDLSVATTDLSEDEKTLSTLHHDCMTGAEDFEAETKSRGEELKALATAKQIIQEATAGAADQSYSFLQQQMSSGADLANFEAVRYVRDLAHKTKDASLAQLASRMAVAMRQGGSAGDPFGKVKDLIRNMIEKLNNDAQADATEKAYCDKEMAETEQKQTEKEAAIDKLNSQIDSMSATSAKRKEEVATLQKELAEIAKAQAKMDKIRAEEKSAYDTNSAEMEKGIKGVRAALKVLNDYYAKTDKAHSSADGAGSGIIGLLEVCESDFTKGLAEMNSAEQTAVSEYEAASKENAIDKATKDQSVKYKTKEFKGLDKDTADANADKASVQTELDAINEYFKGIKARCVAKAESYSDRVARREAEIAGLKEALQILEGEAALLQRTSKRALRGVRVHA